MFLSKHPVACSILGDVIAEMNTKETIISEINYKLPKTDCKYIYCLPCYSASYTSQLFLPRFKGAMCNPNKF